MSPDGRRLAVAAKASVALVSFHMPEHPLLLRSRFGPSDIQDVVFDASSAYVGAISRWAPAQSGT